jgi:hypothetical protein
MTPAEPEEAMRLVELRCRVRGCGRLLGWLDSAPAESDELRWSYPVPSPIPFCPRHGGAHQYGSITRWVEARRRLGLPHDRVTTGRWISWEELRSAVREARRTKKTQVHKL